MNRQLTTPRNHHSITPMMMRIFLLTLLLLPALHLTACGLKPVYGVYANEQDLRSELSTIRINNIPNRLGQNLRNNLIDILYISGYPAADSPYLLNVSSLDEREISLGIAKDASATRAQIRLNAIITLMDTKTDKTLFTRRMMAVASYNNLPSQYTTEVAKSAAREDATRDLSHQIITALELYFTNPSAYAGKQIKLSPLPEQTDLIDDLGFEPVR